MDDLTAMKSFRAERDAEPPGTREAIWRALAARMDASAAESRAFGETVAGSATPAPPATRRHGLRAHRRRLLAFAGATVAAAAIAGALVLSSGPTAQPASAAEILHRAATAATARAAGGGPTTMTPGPGQYLFTKARRLVVEGWYSPVPPFGADKPVSEQGGTLRGPQAYNAVVATTLEQWLGPEGRGRNREIASPLLFWSRAEEARWKAAGSPLPPPFNPEYRRLYGSAFKGAREASSHVIDTSHGTWRHFAFPDTSKLPTEPKALRHQVEHNEIEVKGFNLMFPGQRHLDPEQTTEQLVNCLREGEATPALQAAVFDALAELPNVRLDTGATDGLGRRAYAIVLRPKEGLRTEYLFDPETGAGLAQRTTLVDPAKAYRGLRGIPAGTVTSENDLIEATIVESRQETGKGAEAGAPTGGAGPTYRR